MKKLLAMLLALVMALSMLTIAAFAESGDVEVDEDPSDVEVTEENPETGLALAVLPMVAAAAAVVLTKKN